MKSPKIYSMKKIQISVLAHALAFVAAASPVAHADDNCVPTEPDSLGPFYVSDMPVMENISRFGKPGEEIEVSGVVRSAGEGLAPIAGASVEVWHSDSEGEYHPSGSGVREDYEDSELDMRGTVLTDEEGRFAFRTVVPAIYGFSIFTRPRHFHYRVTAPGHAELVTQHYVREDGKMPGGPCRSAEIERGEGSVRFESPDIFLRPAGTQIRVGAELTNE